MVLVVYGGRCGCGRMVDTKKIKALFDRDFIHHEVFNYLSTDEKWIVKERLERNESLAVGVFQNGKFLFAAIFDFEGDCIHVREVSGSFASNCDQLYRLSLFLCEITKASYITLNTRRKGVGRLAKMLGFEKNCEGEFVKAV